jgi:hypothetical protein
MSKVFERSVDLIRILAFTLHLQATMGDTGISRKTRLTPSTHRLSTVFARNLIG